MTRLDAAERKEEIIASVRKLFAHKGFHGVTTRELAKAAGVSEGLLFKYFPSKEALFTAIKLACHGKVGNLLQGPPSTSALVQWLRMMFKGVLGVFERPADADVGRLLLRSLAEDTRFARQFFAETYAPRIAWAEKCLAVAAKEGDLKPFKGRISPRVWFVQLLAFQLGVASFSAERLIEQDLPIDELADEAVRFALRGLGFEEQAIQRELRGKP